MGGFLTSTVVCCSCSPLVSDGEGVINGGEGRTRRTLERKGKRSDLWKEKTHCGPHGMCSYYCFLLVSLSIGKYSK